MARGKLATWNLDTIVSAFNAASLDPTHWRSAMEAITRETGSYGAAVLPTAGYIPHRIFTESLVGLSERYFKEGWYTRDLRFRAVPLFKQRAVLSEPHYTSDEEIARHDYFQDLLAEFDLRWSALVRMTVGAETWCVALQRSLAQGPYSKDELAALASLSTPLSAAGTMTSALGFARAEAAAQAFQISGTPALLLGRQGYVLSANTAAEALFGPDLDVKQKRLRSADSHANIALDEALKSVYSSSLSSVQPHAPVILPRRGRLPLLAYVMRLPMLSVDVFAPCQAAILLHDPQASAAPRADVLRLVYGLSAAEARIAVLLAEGLTIADASERLRISALTGRNQIGSAMSKMGVGRQAELVAAVMRLAPRIKTSTDP